MKFCELPAKHKMTALQWAEDAINDLYQQQGIPKVDALSPEVIQLAKERDYEIEYGEYEPGIPYERLSY